MSPRQELEEHFEIVLLAENARMELKSSTNESWNLPGSNAPCFVAFQAKNTELWWLEGPKKDHRRIKEGSKNGQIIAVQERLTKLAVLAMNAES
jgi:hypothetical protein